MNNNTTYAIAALGEGNRAIGFNGEIPWHIPGELKRFKEITFGHPIIMGRKTFESIGRALPGRTNIVVTRNEGNFPDTETANSIEGALEIAKQSNGSDKIFIIGGGQIYTEALPYTDVLMLTVVHGDFQGDAFFPDYSEFTHEIFREEHTDTMPSYTFLHLER